MKLKMPKIKWPLVSRKKLEAAEHRAIIAEGMRQSSEIQLREMRDELTPKILQILDKIFHTKWKRHRPPSRRYCLLIEFDEYMIHNAFIHGNNTRELEYMARYIGDMAVRDIRQINFARYVDEPEERGYRVPTFNPDASEPWKP